MEPVPWSNVAQTACVCAAVVGIVWAVAWGLARAFRDFTAHEAEVARQRADLTARLAGGCRQRVVPPQDKEKPR